jgi:chloramphenicol-sensitive protein RarD
MHFLDSPSLTLLFLGGGIVTAFPLIWFISATKLLPLSTVGFLQYLAPTLQLMVGVLWFREQFTLRHGIAFSLIWVAIAVFLANRRRSSSFDPLTRSGLLGK